MVTTPGKIAVGIAFMAMSVALLGNVTVLAKAQNNCTSIEKLNARVRENAQIKYTEAKTEAAESIASLDEEARLLGIVVTPELRARVASDANARIEKAKLERDRLWKQYAADKCPFFGS